MASLHRQKLQPGPGRLIVKPDEQKQSGRIKIFIPDGAQKKPTSGTVIGYSDKSELLPPGSMRKPSRVYFSQFSGTELDVDGEKIVVLKEEDVLAIEEIK
jgi:chaperonin GroES